ncbi:MAG: sigma-54-dependent Fis family transcriptional regulator [Deltaproteobacteria bacterium]|nr:sigma-54-dependent Fis family transcriptional regulator [Deltaproteobacteria bacterium]
MRRPNLLVVDDSSAIRSILSKILKDHYDVSRASDGLEALEAIKRTPVDIVLLDLNLPKLDGYGVIDAIKKDYGEEAPGIIVISSMDSAEKAVRALKAGAYDYVTKPFQPETILAKLKRYVDSMELRQEVAFLKEELNNRLGDINIISQTPGMKLIFEMVRKVGETSTNVLILGESGTGKELIARAVHSLAVGRKGAFVAVNCGAIPAELMESEFFGHEKGAFSGATSTKLGRFEYADGGTLFLDEISTLPKSLQVKLLRVLQERSFERVGSNKEIKVDIRIIAATNVDLLDAVKAGTFREDLYYRLNVVPIVMLPLRERIEDIEPLVKNFIDIYSKKYNKKVNGISIDATKMLKAYCWPGNVRELENLIERLVVLAKENAQIEKKELPIDILSEGCNMIAISGACHINDYKEARREFEKEYILNVLKKASWNRMKAASIMNVHRNTLALKIKNLNIDIEGQRRTKPPTTTSKRSTNA